MTVDRALGDTRLGGDRIHADGAVAGLQEQLARRRDDLVGF